MGRAAGFGAGKVKGVEGFETALLQRECAFLDIIRERDVLCSQSQALLNPVLAQRKRIAAVLQIVNGRMDQPRASPPSINVRTRLNESVSSQMRGCRWSSKGRFKTLLSR